MFRNTFGADWRKSSAHLFLLSMFLEPRAPETILTGAWGEKWEGVLREPADKAIKRFQKEGLLVESDLAGKLDFCFKVTDLKDALRQRNLTVSGRKPDLIARLLAADPKGMEKAIKGIAVLVCSDAGRVVAEQYRSGEHAKREAAEQQVLLLLQQGRYRDACMTMAAFEATQVFPRGIGIDWNSYKPERDTEILTTVFNERPKILSRVHKDRLDVLRVGAAMAYLWGINSARKWLPADYETGIKLDPDPAARMLEFHAISRRTINEYRASKVVKAAKVQSVPECCPECKKISGKQFKLNNAIELPYEHCTSAMGCRCTWIAVLD